MDDKAWLYWLALIVLLAVVQGVKRLVRRNPDQRMDRAAAAAERILRQRKDAVQQPVQAGRPGQSARVNKAHAQKAQVQKARVDKVLAAPRTVAVIRRGGLLGGKEPVIRRRH